MIFALLLSLIATSITTCSQTPNFKLEAVSKDHPGCRTVPSIRHLIANKNSGEVIISERIYNPEGYCVQPCNRKYLLQSSPDGFKELQMEIDLPGPTYLLLRNNVYVNGLWYMFDGKK